MAKNKKNFDDVKMIIATLSITMTIVFWNLFAGSANNTETVSAENIPQITATVEPIVQVEPTPTFVGKILLGGEAPQPRVVVVQQKSGGGGGGNNGGGGGNGGAGGGGGTTTTTKAS